MWASLRELKAILGARRFWTAILKLTLVASLGLAIIVAAMTAMVLLLPFVLIAALVVYLRIRSALRRAARHRRHDGIIDGEYTVVETR